MKIGDYVANGDAIGIVTGVSCNDSIVSVYWGEDCNLLDCDSYSKELTITDKVPNIMPRYKLFDYQYTIINYFKDLYETTKYEGYRRVYLLSSTGYLNMDIFYFAIETVREYETDKIEAHRIADDILRFIAISDGYKEVVDVYDTIRKI